MRWWILPVALTLGAAGPLAAQAPEPATVDQVEPDTMRAPISPRTAFIGSMILPGWGQSQFGYHGRGSIYFAGWGANWFMNFRNQVRLTEARNRLDIRRDQIAEAMIAASADPDSMRIVLETTGVLEQALRDDPHGSDLHNLVRSREQQREDWIAWSLFWVLASGIDAFVTAHLADFPAGIDLETNADRSVSIRVDLPLPRRRP